AGTLLPVASGNPADQPERWPVRRRTVTHRGAVLSLRVDEVAAPDGSRLLREAVVHPGAVGIVALDEDDRMLLVRQYRHAVGQRLLQAPAGLLDVPDEDPLTTAQRELYEEGHVTAARWRVLVDYLASPGSSTEAVRIYLAEQLDVVPEEHRFPAEHEEADMDVVWVPLQRVVDGVLAGTVQDALLALGVLACWTARHRATAQSQTGAERAPLGRPAGAPWPTRDGLLRH
ncbi:MAG: NUDIX hydrolase, partial [Actinomycetota bacterium]|nr:NUDIX hydrolase [Actinomycetota bacterium]